MAWSNKELISFGSLTVTDTGWEASRASTWCNFPIFRQFFPCVLPWARIDADQIQKTLPLPNLVVSVQHPEIQSIQKSKHSNKQFPPTSRRPYIRARWQSLRWATGRSTNSLSPSCQTTGDNAQWTIGSNWTIGQCPVDNWTIGQLDQNSAFQRAFCQAAHLMCQFMCNNIGNPLLCTGICFLFGVEHLENGDNPDFHPDLNYLR